MRKNSNKTIHTVVAFKTDYLFRIIYLYAHARITLKTKLTFFMCVRFAKKIKKMSCRILFCLRKKTKIVALGSVLLGFTMS